MNVIEIHVKKCKEIHALKSMFTNLRLSYAKDRYLFIFLFGKTEMYLWINIKEAGSALHIDCFCS